MSEVLAAVLGFAGGVVGGLLGVGGGILFVPALVLFLDHGQLSAEATSLLAIVPVAIVGTARQIRYGNVRLADGLWIGALSVPGVALGVIVANNVAQRTLELAFAVLLVFVAVQLVRRALRDGDDGASSGGRGGPVHDNGSPERAPRDRAGTSGA